MTKRSQSVNRPQKWKLGVLAGVFLTSAGAGTVGGSLAASSWANNSQCRSEPKAEYAFDEDFCDRQQTIQRNGALVALGGFSGAAVTLEVGRRLQRRGDIDVNEVKLFQGL